MHRPGPDLVSAGATFSFVDLTTHGGERVLLLDVLALAVQPGPSERRGVGTSVVQSLKALVRQEAQRLGNAWPLLLTQADLSCVGFWAKAGFARSLDANALLRSLRRASDATLFTGAVPMAHLMDKPPTRTPGAVMGPLLKAPRALNPPVFAVRTRLEKDRTPRDVRTLQRVETQELSVNPNLNMNSETRRMAVSINTPSRTK